MLAFQQGDAQAFSRLVERHRRAVFNFIFRYVGERGRAEDLLQEAWLKVVRGAGDYEPRARFTTWLYTVARNLCTDHARRERFRKAQSLDAAPAGAPDDARPLGERIASDGASPDRAAHAQRLAPLLMKAIASLPEEQREVFCLREFAGIPFRQIAEVTRTPENTVKSRMRYALDALRRRLTEMGVDGEWDSDRSAAG